MCTEKVLIRKVRRRIVQQNVSVSYCTAKNCTEAEVVLWRPGHYKLRRENFDLSGRHNEGCDGGMYKETCRGEIDFRIQGLPHSAVQEHDHIRKEAVQKWIHQFETHPNKEALQADLEQNRAFNPVIEQSKEMNDLLHGKHGVLRDLRDHSQNTVLQLFDILDGRH